MMHIMTTIVGRTVLALLLFATTFPTATVRAAEDWNDKEIAWQPYEAGLALAKKEKKPVCLIFFTPSCEHCANYAKIFDDPAVVAKAKDFVMIRLEVNDQNAELAFQYAPDGQYVPRTLFLSPDGDLWTDVHAPRDQYKYFYQDDPKTTLAGMDAALRKLIVKVLVTIPFTIQR
jgi:protein-disulfide reductase (glutathione)